MSVVDMKTTTKGIIATVLPALFGLLSSVSAAQTIPLAMQQQVVEIKGIEVPELVGVDFDQVAMFTFEQGVLAPIPFQFDDIDEDGNVHFQENQVPLRGSAGVLDEHDSLLVRYQDMGSRLPDYKAYGNRILAEVRATHNDVDRYFYVVQGVEPENPPSFTSYDQETGRIETSHFTLDTHPSNFFIWDKFVYKNYDGDQNVSLIDTLKMRLNAGLLARYPRITLDNNDIETRLLAVREGPLRTTLLIDATVRAMNVPVIFITLHFDVYPQEVDIRALVDVPAVLAKMLNKPRATVTIDGNDLHGSIVRTALGPKRPVVVDGVMEPEEEKLVGDGVDNDNTWIWLSTRRNLDVLAQFYVPKNFDAPISLVYQDDKELKEKPERVQGQSPNVGYHLADIPVDDTFDFQMRIMVTDTMGDMEPVEFARVAKTPPIIATQSNTQAIKLVQSH